MSERELEGISSELAGPEGAQLLEGWQSALEAAVCEVCDWRYLMPARRSLPRCPHCFEGALVPLGKDVGALPTVRPPEFMVPPALSGDTLARGVEAFAGTIPYPPEDLKAETLEARLEQVYLPSWLVDVDVEAVWEAEVGYDYEVVSHEERYDDRRGGWVTREVEERRTRWERRVGRLTRRYDNVRAPALEDDAGLRKALGEWDEESREPYGPSAVADAAVALPDRTPDDAWSSAVPRVRQRAAEECREAAGADHLRQFLWTPEYAARTWTLLLLPLYTTYYEDDEGRARALLIHGQTGRIDGARRGSMVRARRVSLIVGLVALALFVIGLGVVAAGLMVPPLAALGAIGVLVALLVGGAALVPMLRVWWFNRRQDARSGS